VHVAGEYTVGSVDLPNSVNQLDLKVYTATGQLVRTISMGPQDGGMVQFAWDGINDDGQMMPSGVYRFEAETRNGGTTRAADTYLNTQVLSVELGRNDNSMTLETRSMGSVDFSTVRRIS
jgi:flagellar basal-body rod modification protein FlgD